MFKQSVWTSLIAASIASKHLKEYVLLATILNNKSGPFVNLYNGHPSLGNASLFSESRNKTVVLIQTTGLGLQDPARINGSWLVQCMSYY